MDSGPPMLQVYRDDEHASVPAPLLALNPDAQTAQPRWSNRSNKNNNLARGAIATGAFLATYLFFCAWVAFANNGSSLAQRADSNAFPHRRLPWPFPGRRHPHPHPHHPHHRPHPIVLGCTAIPTPSADVTNVNTNIELNVTLPRHAVVLGGTLLHGDVSIKKVNQSEATIRTMLVGIKVANRTWGPPPPEDDQESTPESFVLCAITFPGPQPPPSPPTPPIEDQAALTSSHHPPPHWPHRHPHHLPPVIVAIFPALNETYPKFLGPPGSPPPPHGPPGLPGPTDGNEPTTMFVRVSTDSVLMTAWKSTISFLFPMLNVFPSHGRFHVHSRPACRHHRPPPPPPFVVTELDVTLSKCTRVLFDAHGPPYGHWGH